MAHKDTDDLFTYTGGHTVQTPPKHRAEPDGTSHKKPSPKGAHRAVTKKRK